MSRPDGAPLRIVLVHRYFAPDTPPYAEILRVLATALAERGAVVTVLTCQPSYRRGAPRAPRRETVGSVSVVRWPVLDDRRSTVLKVVNLVWFCLRLALSRRRFRDADVVMAATTPPVAVALVCSMLARSSGARFVYHKQDVWPEVAAVTGRRLGPLTTLLRRLDHATEKRAARVVVLSRDMADTVAGRGRRGGDDAVDTVVLNNFDPWQLDDLPDALPAAHDDVTLTFAGNLGRFQGIDRLVEVIRAARTLPLQWHFFGDGPMAGRLAELASDGAAVTMHGFQPARAVAEFVRFHTDLGVVSLEPGVIRAAYPSKTLSYLRNGCPVLALVEPDSELAEMVADSGAGIAVGYDVARVVEALGRWSVAPDRSADVRRAAERLYEERFGRSRQLERWTAMFDELAS